MKNKYSNKNDTNLSISLPHPSHHYCLCYHQSSSSSVAFFLSESSLSTPLAIGVTDEEASCPSSLSLSSPSHPFLTVITIPQTMSRAPIPAKPKNMVKPIVGSLSRSFTMSAKFGVRSADCVNHRTGTITLGTSLKSLENKISQFKIWKSLKKFLFSNVMQQVRKDILKQCKLHFLTSPASNWCYSVHVGCIFGLTSPYGAPTSIFVDLFFSLYILF